MKLTFAGILVAGLLTASVIAGAAMRPQQTAQTDTSLVFLEKPSAIAAQKGKVTLLAFWTYGCINCQRTVPYWNDWATKYGGKNGDVSVLSVHTPELNFERDPDNVRRYLAEKNIKFGVILDNEYTLWNAYRVQMWPTTFLIDKKGKVRYRWEGELNWQNRGTFREVERAIEKLRREKVETPSE